MASPFLQIAHVADTAQKAPVVNEQTDDLDRAMNQHVVIDVSAGGQIVVTDVQAKENILLRLTGAPGAGFELVMPVEQRLIAIHNQVTDGSEATIGVNVTAGTWDTLAAGEASIFHIDGENAIKIAGGGGGASTFLALTDTPNSFGSGDAGLQVVVGEDDASLAFIEPPYDIGQFFGGTPPGDTIIMRFLVNRAFTLPEDLANSQGHAEVAPDADTDFDIQQNGGSVGTMSFANGATTATFTMASATVFAVGDRLDIVSPTDLDYISDISWTLAGNR